MSQAEADPLWKQTHINPMSLAYLTPDQAKQDKTERVDCEVFVFTTNAAADFQFFQNSYVILVKSLKTFCLQNFSLIS